MLVLVHWGSRLTMMLFMLPPSCYADFLAMLTYSVDNHSQFYAGRTDTNDRRHARCWWIEVNQLS